MLDTQHFKEKLEAHLAHITSELTEIAVLDPHTDDWQAIPTGTDVAEPDENDEADVVEEWNERRSTTAVLETDYRNLKRALNKIAGGTYGICEVSGHPIEVERLEANPAARTCVAHMNDESTLSL